jgi:hypothetical protein
MTHLEHDHHPMAIRRRLAVGHRPSYLPAAILGGIDGCVTTIAVIASVAGAGLPGVIAFVLGAASLVADGFSMAVSNYQAVKSEGDARDRLRRQEERHIDQVPEGLAGCRRLLQAECSWSRAINSCPRGQSSFWPSPRHFSGSAQLD